MVIVCFIAANFSMNAGFVTELAHSEDFPPQVKDAEKIGYLPDTTPLTAKPIVRTVYYYDGKWWDVEWFGMWFVDEHIGPEGEVIYNSEAEALEAVKNGEA